jgi:hypothetical protein
MLRPEAGGYPTRMTTDDSATGESGGDRRAGRPLDAHDGALRDE